MITATCKWCVYAALTLGALATAIFGFYMFYTPYYYVPISASIVTSDPIYPGSTIVLKYEYCIHIKTSTFISQFSNGFVHALTPTTFFNQTGCFQGPSAKMFSKQIPAEWTPDHYTYSAAHLIAENPVRDALIGQELVADDPVKFVVSPRP